VEELIYDDAGSDAEGSENEWLTKDKDEEGYPGEVANKSSKKKSKAKKGSSMVVDVKNAKCWAIKRPGYQIALEYVNT
jgi:hypothetical protein